MKEMMLLRATLLALAALLLPPVVAATARADMVLVSNLAEPEIIPVIGFNDTFIEAASFTTSSIGALLGEASAVISANQGTTIFAEVRVDEDNMPGALVDDLGTVTFTMSGKQTLDFTASGTATLQPLTQYWLVIGTTGGGANWHLTATDNAFSPVGWTVGARTQSNDGGGTWLVPQTDGHLLLSIAVPEPSSLILAGLGLIGLTARGGRQRRVAGPRPRRAPFLR